MVIINALRFPQESANEVGKRFLEIAPPPDFMSMKGPYIKGTEQGIRAVEIFDLDETKLALGLDYVTQRWSPISAFPASLTRQMSISRHRSR